MTVQIREVKAKEIAFNAFLAKEDQVGDQVQASIILDDGAEIFGMGDTTDEAVEDLRDRVKAHFFAKAHIANLEINKAVGLRFFE